jgi:hypothetical protein
MGSATLIQLVGWVSAAHPPLGNAAVAGAQAYPPYARARQLSGILMRGGFLRGVTGYFNL